MSLSRSVRPEWLDTLPTDDPSAIRSRRDLRVLNAFMLQARIMTRLLSAYSLTDAPRTILELGAGDGTFLLQVARALAPRWPAVRLILLDQQCLVRAETCEAFLARGWTVETVTADVFDFLDGSKPDRVDITTANLFLHHFHQSQLMRIFEHLARLTRLFVACEPRRSGLALSGSHMVWTLGCNRVTRHDAPASVWAGFAGKELTTLWPRQDGWQLHEQKAGLFTHGFVARHGS